jgi:predicted transcriptional regulator
MADLRSRLGLDYLQKRGGEPDDRQSGRSALDEARLAYARPLLDALRRASPGPVHLYQLIDELGVPIDLALKLVDDLESRGYLTVVNRDLKGNHELRLTDEGARVLR